MKPYTTCPLLLALPSLTPGTSAFLFTLHTWPALACSVLLQHARHTASDLWTGCALCLESSPQMTTSLTPSLLSSCSNVNFLVRLTYINFSKLHSLCPCAQVLLVLPRLCFYPCRTPTFCWTIKFPFLLCLFSVLPFPAYENVISSGAGIWGF